MSASSYEYKTVALPQVVQAKRRRGVSEADFVAETLGELIHLEAVDGWEYLRADTLAAGSRGGMFSKEAKVTHYSVLVFRRIQEEVWPLEQVTPVDAPSAVRPRPAVSQAPAAAPAAAAPAAAAAPVAPKPAPVTAPAPLAEQTPAPTPPPPAPTPAPPPPAPVRPMVGDPTSPLANGGMLSTGGTIDLGTSDSGILGKARPAPRVAPRPPLGSAQD